MTSKTDRNAEAVGTNTVENLRRKKLDSPNTLIALGPGWKDRSWAMPLAGATDYESIAHVGMWRLHTYHKCE